MVGIVVRNADVFGAARHHRPEVESAFEALSLGKLNCTVECNPLIGPQLFDAAEKIAKGEKLPKRIVVKESGYALRQKKHYARV